MSSDSGRTLLRVITWKSQRRSGVKKSDPIVITAHSLRQLHPGTWKIPIKGGTEEITNLLSALQKLTKIPHFKSSHPLTSLLVRELIRQ